MSPGLIPKTPSQRLRAVMYLYWEQSELLKQKYPEFNEYYKAQVDVIIQHFKEKLTKLKLTKLN